LAKKIDSAVFPGLQGGPHNATTAAIAVAAREAGTASFRRYGQQVRKNAAALAEGLRREGLQLVGGGTDNHLLIVDFSEVAVGMGGMIARALDVAGIYANKNTVPGEKGSPVYPSGLRLGTPLVTTRGMKEREMKQVAQWIGAVSRQVMASRQLPEGKEEKRAYLEQFLQEVEGDKYLRGVEREVRAFAREFPLFAWPY
jgi:glycine hydroxymethyltransferase